MNEDLDLDDAELDKLFDKQINEIKAKIKARKEYFYSESFSADIFLLKKYLETKEMIFSDDHYSKDPHVVNMSKLFERVYLAVFTFIDSTNVDDCMFETIKIEYQGLMFEEIHGQGTIVRASILSNKEK